MHVERRLSALPVRSTRPSWPSFTEAERARLEQLQHLQDRATGYMQIQATRPQTLAYGLNDSPVGQLAWIVEKFKEWTDPAAELPEDAVDRDQLLTNVMLYWLTGTAGSSAHLYYETAHAGAWGAASGPPSRPASRCSPHGCRDPAHAEREHTSCTGPSSTAAATSPPWRARPARRRRPRVLQLAALKPPPRRPRSGRLRRCSAHRLIRAGSQPSSTAAPG